MANPTMSSDPVCANVLRVLAPERLGPDVVREFRAAILAGTRCAATELLEPTVPMFDAMLAAIDRNDPIGATEAFERYFSRMRTLHDVLVELVAFQISAIAELHGQAVMEKVLRESFVTCLFYEGLWAAVRAMTHEETAAFLAEHLRAHFSGAGRSGSVEVVEEHDRYRLIFDPCGSGGAMRRRAAHGVPFGSVPMAEPSPLNWFKAGEVPGYCSHCAINELESMRRLGYPVFVTEFDPDPTRPCGWTIFKSPDQIPEQYFARLGATRDPAVFQRPGART
jgi:hypothetical protein